jgi:hypothetical protein
MANMFVMTCGNAEQNVHLPWLIRGKLLEMGKLGGNKLANAVYCAKM